MRNTPFDNLVFAALLATASLGCAAETYADRRDEVVDVPETYGDRDLEGIETESWCSNFGRKGLDRAVRTTWRENLALKAAWARLEQARARVAQSRAPLWPGLQAGVGSTVSNDQGRLPDSARDGSGGSSVQATFEASLTASYEVDLWGKYRHRAKAAKYRMVAARSAARSLAVSLTSQVAEAWFDVVAGRQQLELIDRQLEASRELLQLTKVRYRKGLAEEIDITQQRQNVKSLQGERIEARRDLEVDRQRLNVLTGTEPGDEGVPTADSLPTMPEMPETGVPADLVKRRPDIQAALARLRAADEETAAAVADQLPTLELSAGLFLQVTQLGNLLDQLIWSASAALGQVILDGGRLEAAEREAESVAEERLYQYGQTLLEALEDVQNALVGERRQRELVDKLEEERAAAEASLESARSQYREGGGDYFRILDALQRLQQTERELLDARRQRFSYRISLCRALAGSWATERTSPLPDDADDESGDETGGEEADDTSGDDGDSA